MWAASNTFNVVISIKWHKRYTKINNNNNNNINPNQCVQLFQFTVYYLRVGLTGTTEYKQQFSILSLCKWVLVGLLVYCVCVCVFGRSSAVLNRVFSLWLKWIWVFFVEEDVDTFRPVVFRFHCHYQCGLCASTEWIWCWYEKYRNRNGKKKHAFLESNRNEVYDEDERKSKPEAEYGWWWPLPFIEILFDWLPP